MKHLVLTWLFLLLGYGQIIAQILAEGKFHQGNVKDKEGNTWGGKIKYDTQKQTVLVDLGGSVKTFNARNIESFSFYDERVRANRKFLSLMYAKNPNTNYESAQFFELLTEGDKITLLGTEYLETRMNPQPGWGWYGMGGTTFSYRIVTEYYALTKNGKVVKLKTNKKKHFLAQLKDQAPKIEAFMKKNRLGLQQRLDMVKIIDYYNTL